MNKKILKAMVYTGLSLALLAVPVSPVALTNTNGIMTESVQAATVSKKYVMTVDSTFQNIALSYSNSSIATVKKNSSTKCTISNVKSGTTTVTAKSGNVTYKTNVKVTVDSKGYVTLTFKGSSNMSITSSNSNVFKVTTTKNSDGSKTFKIVTKGTGTANLKLTMGSMSTTVKYTVS